VTILNLLFCAFVKATIAKIISSVHPILFIDPDINKLLVLSARTAKLRRSEGAQKYK
jgi:hypothetical protein